MSAQRPLAVGITPMETRREVVLRLAALAEELGYSAFSVAEGWGSDAAVLLTEIATRTTRIELATGVLNIWGRTPATIAMLAAGLADVSGGRFALGLGAGSPSSPKGCTTCRSALLSRGWARSRARSAASSTASGWSGRRGPAASGWPRHPAPGCRCTWPRSGPPRSVSRARSPTHGARS